MTNMTANPDSRLDTVLNPLYDYTDADNFDWLTKEWHWLPTFEQDTSGNTTSATIAADDKTTPLNTNTGTDDDDELTSRKLTFWRRW